MKNLQILLETIVKCGGNCSGCALSSSERMESVEFDFFNFSQKAKKINQLLQTYPQHDIESLTVFLGQGDHFLMTNEQIPQFMKICSQIVPDALKHKTVIFITASALAKTAVIKEKMDKFYEYSLEYKIPFFIQTVFDPKKIVLHDKFKKTYIDNILYFKEKCGMTELTINLGQDIIEQMSPGEFHEWVKEYGFKHVEMNWVLNRLTHKMWLQHSDAMYSWLKDWLRILKTDYVYEVNFVPIMSRQIHTKTKNLIAANTDIVESLKDNIYIDYDGNIILGQSGMISNLTPFSERLIKGNNINTHLTGGQIYKSIEKEANVLSRKITKKLLQNPSCLECEYQTVCSLSGSVAWFDYQDNATHCPWNIKDFMAFIDLEMLGAINVTNFDKNPIQSETLKQYNNEGHEYFEEKFL